MKKKAIYVVALAISCLMLFAACLPESGLGAIEEAYKQIDKASTITEKVTVKKNALATYESATTYTKGESAYEMNKTTKSLNDLEQDEQYTEETVTETKQLSESFTGGLHLDSAYFDTCTVEVESGSGSLTATVKSAAFDNLFGITSEHGEVTNATLSMTVEGGNVTTISIAFAVDGYAVTISIALTYPSAAVTE